MQTKR